MKYISLNNIQLEQETVMSEFKQAQKYSNVYIGNSVLFLKNGFSIYYITYETLKYAFRRVMVVPLLKKQIEVDYLVIADKRKELAQIKIPGHNMANTIIERLKEKSPNTNFKCPDRIKH